MLDKELLEILCCPITKQPFQEASASELEAINKAAGGKETLEAALITSDKKFAYPIRHGIPALLAEERIALE